jgi:hypothetical protein
MVCFLSYLTFATLTSPELTYVPHFFCSVEKQQFRVPRTVTCHVLSSDTLAAVTLDACQDDHGQYVTKNKNRTETSPPNGKPNHKVPKLVLAGLHACGDLSVNMLRWVNHGNTMK